MREELSVREARVTVALLQENTFKAAARRAGVSERTVYRYVRLARVQKELRKRRSELFSASLSGLQDAWNLTGSTLARVMRDEKASGAARVSAARAALKAGEVMGLYDDLAGRVAGLEEGQKVIGDRS